MDEPPFARGVMTADSRTRAYRRSAVEQTLGWLAAGAIVAFVAVMLVLLM